MRMKNVYLIISFCLLFFLSVKLYAQKIYLNRNDRIIMISTPKTNLSTNDHKSNNGAIYIEIAPLDLGTCGFGKGEMTMDWTTADSLCKKMREDGFGWRLPTQQELLLIWLSQDSLEVVFNQLNKNRQQTAVSFDSDNYWSSTEICERSARAVDFCTGSRGNYKSNKNRVRCVREMP